MGLTTERKVFLGLVGVAGLALFIDQGILGPKEASADPLPLTAEAIDEAATTIIQPSAEKPAAAILIDRLLTVSPNKDGSLGSSFSLTQLIEPSSTEQMSNVQDGAISAETPDTSFPVIAPRADDLPVLSSAMPAANGGGGAVLGGKLLRVGEVDANGYRLVLVHARAVLVERDGVQYAIEIPTISGQE